MKISDKVKQRVIASTMPFVEEAGRSAHLASQVIQNTVRSDAVDDEKGHWVTTEEGNHMFINEEGVPTKGNPHVLAAARGENGPKKSSAKSSSAAEPAKSHAQGGQSRDVDFAGLKKAYSKNKIWHEKSATAYYQSEITDKVNEGERLTIKKKGKNGEETVTYKKLDHGWFENEATGEKKTSRILAGEVIASNEKKITGITVSNANQNGEGGEGTATAKAPAKAKGESQTGAGANKQKTAAEKDPDRWRKGTMPSPKKIEEFSRICAKNGIDPQQGLEILDKYGNDIDRAIDEAKRTSSAASTASTHEPEEYGLYRNGAGEVVGANTDRFSEEDYNKLYDVVQSNPLIKDRYEHWHKWGNSSYESVVRALQDAGFFGEETRKGVRHPLEGMTWEEVQRKGSAGGNRKALET